MNCGDCVLDVAEALFLVSAHMGRQVKDFSGLAAKRGKIEEAEERTMRNLQPPSRPG